MKKRHYEGRRCEQGQNVLFHLKKDVLPVEDLQTCISEFFAMIQSTSATEIQSYLRDSELVSVTIRIHRTLRDSAKEAASLGGMNNTSFTKGLVIEELGRRD